MKSLCCLIVIIVCAGCAARGAAVLHRVTERARAMPAAIAKVPPYATTDEHGNELVFLELRTRELGYTLEYLAIDSLFPDMQGADGVSNLSSKRIWLDTELPTDGRIAVLAHELGHMYHPYGVSRVQAEIFADAVALQVAHALGVNIEPQVTNYMAVYKVGLDVLPTLKVDLQIAVDTILGN